MNTISFKKTYLVLLVMMAFIVIGLYYSYAIFVTKQLQENVVSVKTPSMGVILKVNNEKEKITINGGSEQELMVSIQNNNATNYYYEIFFKGIREGVKVTSTDEVKGYLTNNEIKNIFVHVCNTRDDNVTLEFYVKTSLEENFDKDIGYSYINKVDNYDHSGANKPVMDSVEMIPVAYKKVSDTEGYWYKSDINNNKDLWYSYDVGLWANAVLVNSSNYKKYQKKDIGQEIEMGDVLGFYVWIPRFKYTILNSNNYTNFERINNVFFEKGKESTGTVTCFDKISNSNDNHIYSEVCSDKNGKILDTLSTYTHPAFSDKEGFWVSKFLMGEGNNILKSIPNISIKKDNVDDAINLSERIIKGKSHLLTNMEYGSILILSNSPYGKSGNDNYFTKDNYTFKRIYLNNYQYDVTGCSSDYNNYSKNYISDTSKTCVAYNDSTNYSHVANSINYKIHEVGPGASTTGTINGVYDMAIRDGELVSAFTANIDGNIQFNTNNYDLYSYNSYLGKVLSSNTIINLHRYKLGDGIRENFRSIKENGMWQSGTLEHKVSDGVMLRGGNGDIKYASVYTTTIVDLDYVAPYRVAIK